MANGGRGGIRTHGTVARSLDFESSAFDRTQPPFRAARSVGEARGRLNPIPHSRGSPLIPVSYCKKNRIRCNRQPPLKRPILCGQGGPGRLI